MAFVALASIGGYANSRGFDAPADEIKAQALEWATSRGLRSGRAAWQFIQDLAGRLGKPLVLWASPAEDPESRATLTRATV